MQQALHGFAYQRENGQVVAVVGGQIVNDDDPVLVDHADKFGELVVGYIEPLPVAEPEPEPAPPTKATKAKG